MTTTYRTAVWFDQNGNLRTGFDAHVLAWRWAQTRKHWDKQEAWATLAKRA